MSDPTTLGGVLATVKDLAPKAPTLDNLAKDIHAFKVGQDAKRKRATDHLYITDFAYRPCVRRLAYIFLRPDIKDKSRPPEALFDMDAGTSIHAYFQDTILGPMGVLEGDWECSRCGHIEEGKKPTSPCFGKIKVLDLLDDKWVETSCAKAGMRWKFREQHIKLLFHGIRVTGRPDGKLIVVKGRLLEIKSTEDAKFQEIEIPKDYHIFQASVYGKALGFDEVVIFYVNRNHWDQVKAFVVKVDPGATKAIENCCETVRFLLDKKDPLRASSTVCKNRTASKAKTCGFKDVCHPLKGRKKSGK